MLAACKMPSACPMEVHVCSETGRSPPALGGFAPRRRPPPGAAAGGAAAGGGGGGRAAVVYGARAWRLAFSNQRHGPPVKPAACLCLSSSRRIHPIIVRREP